MSSRKQKKGVSAEQRTYFVMLAKLTQLSVFAFVVGRDRALEQRHFAFDFSRVNLSGWKNIKSTASKMEKDNKSRVRLLKIFSFHVLGLLFAYTPHRRRFVEVTFLPF